MTLEFVFIFGLGGEPFGSLSLTSPRLGREPGRESCLEGIKKVLSGQECKPSALVGRDTEIDELLGPGNTMSEWAEWAEITDPCDLFLTRVVSPTIKGTSGEVERDGGDRVSV